MHDCVAAILRRDGLVLLCHRAAGREWFPSVWDLPGGHVEVNETGPAALARELREELAIHIAVPTTPPVVAIEDAALDLRLAIWVIESWRGTPTNRAPDEHDRLAWCSLDELPRLTLADERYRALLHETLAARAR